LTLPIGNSHVADDEAKKMNYERLAIDTHIAVPLINRDPGFRQFTRGYVQLCMPVVVLAELHHGILRSNAVSQNLEQLEQFIRRCEILVLDATGAMAWAELRLKLISLGRPIPRDDLWIAAICIGHQVPLATVDAHFNDLPGLDIVRP
jgi:tRNA(fMet)-specific endonuclease VapC